MAEPQLQHLQHPDLAQTDEALYGAFVSHGSPKALDELVARHLPFAYRIAFSSCGEQALAEEVVQECCLILAQRQASFQDRGPGSFRAWFCAVLLNKARQLKSSRRWCPSRQTDSEPLARRLVEAPLASERGEQLARLSAALRDLEDPLRIPLLLHFHQGLAQEQIAQALKISQSLVSRRIAQALRTLKKRLVAAGLSSLAPRLPSLLAEGDLIPVPGSLGRGLSRSLSERPVSRIPIGPAPARFFQNRMLAWMGFSLAVLAMTLPLKMERPAAVGAPASRQAGTAAISQGGGSPQRPKRAAGGTPGPFYARWSFLQGIPADLERLAGTWSHWTPARNRRPAGGVALPGINNAVVVRLPLQIPPVPLRLTARIWMPAQFAEGHGGLQLLWLGPESKPLQSGYVTYHAAHTITPERAIPYEIYIYRQFVLSWFESLKRGTNLAQYASPYPSRTVALAIHGLAVESIEVEEVQERRLPSLLQNLESIQQLQQREPGHWIVPPVVFLNREKAAQR